jgi:hypothetical protein
MICDLGSFRLEFQTINVRAKFCQNRQQFTSKASDVQDPLPPPWLYPIGKSAVDRSVLIGETARSLIIASSEFRRIMRLDYLGWRDGIA